LVTDTTESITAHHRQSAVAARASHGACLVVGLLAGVYAHAQTQVTPEDVRGIALAVIIFFALIVLVARGSERTVDAVVTALERAAFRNRNAILDVRQLQQETTHALHVNAEEMKGLAREVGKLWAVTDVKGAEVVGQLNLIRVTLAARDRQAPARRRPKRRRPARGPLDGEVKAAVTEIARYMDRQ
jgi:hypothetical protein